MSTFTGYVDTFFSILEQNGKLSGAKDAYPLLKRALHAFISKEDTDNAFNVYSSFFDTYRVTSNDRKTVFLDLVDLIKQYEENAATLTDKQRDHFIHSVNVFLMGMSVYAMNSSYRTYFDRRYDDRIIAPNPVDEFLFLWGVSALIHDIGYPVEIATNQVNRFARMISSIDNPEPGIKGTFLFTGFEEVRYLRRGIWAEKTDRIRSILGCRPDIDIFDSYDLLALRVSDMVDEPYGRIRETIEDFTDRMIREHFVDHGFYSALILLKWAGSVHQKAAQEPEMFYSYITDSAAAILLHNLYRGVMIKTPYSKPPMDPERAPLAYLLILCDECQDWNRRAYGFRDRGVVRPENGRMIVDEHIMHMDYRTGAKRLSESYADEKLALIHDLVDVHKVFPEGLRMICTCERSADELILSLANDDVMLPRPLLDNIVELAETTHMMYVEERKEEHPESEPEYPTWDSLPQDLRYSNIEQAKDIPEKLRTIGCRMMPVDGEGDPVDKFLPEEETVLAKREHDRWVKERQDNGWIYGPKKDVEKRISPYVADWEDIPEEIQEYDYQAVRRIPMLLSRIGMKICRNNTEQ